MTRVEYKQTEIAVKKNLGQNFLTDRNITRKIVRMSGIGPRDRILEIGPGFGALTREIAEICPEFTVIEKDAALASFIREEFPVLHVIEGDFLEADLTSLAQGEKLHVLGNIPYYITTPILFRLLDNRHHIASETLMMQHEVAERLTAEPGTKEYGILAVQLQSFCRVEYLFKVGKKVFRPKPEVDSAVVRIAPRETSPVIDEEGFRKFIRTAFQQRRKTLSNNLKKTFDLSLVTSFDLQRRAESLTPEEFSQLYLELTLPPSNNHA
ncbi:16S rRNA (adenine(1518)-N(6)/adenine(1519)-N(6))-dimethyltransferase RsmA [Prosthecochloris vibrioformis]|uniref:Ribosomal RNA small subunit methyltransferase A n=1 Tax=Prosthecochloris vibrioformis TaxID=1098 RepID=A0A5C4RYQ7_PROVB|nr:16S rRNA (adenine(1518)-N(6)/adenine(1519)-N(6))-dimethyltransferase RsmA [Prosthecochloris vibrioformis]TNJ36122.1 16S rRNA (adenine(1518)-N(6)/adenine(1519)-N(6))-dimethyltransferase RsmA [Prosthecochloris vibrioformis]